MLALTAADLLTLVIIILIAYLALLWVALAFWMVRDARRRSEGAGLGMLAALLGLLPFLGVVMYLVLRPPRTLDEERALVLEEQALGERPQGGDEPTRPCPTCGREIEVDFVTCPYCRTQFARRCQACQRWLRLGWPVCPYCAEEVARAALPRSASPPGALQDAGGPARAASS